MRSLSGITKTAFLGFFGSHIIFTLIVDLQAIAPPSWIPSFLSDFLRWYAAAFHDPLMGDPRRHLWFQSMIFCEMLFQLPYFFVAVYYLSSNKTVYPRWFQNACVAYGAHTATTLVPILATVATNAAATVAERWTLSCVYLPYLIFPLWILAIAVMSDDDNLPVKPKKS